MNFFSHQNIVTILFYVYILFSKNTKTGAAKELQSQKFNNHQNQYKTKRGGSKPNSLTIR
jgi:hypothetical protein